jgi:hypothetical protein
VKEALGLSDWEATLDAKVVTPTCFRLRSKPSPYRTIHK